MEKPSDLSCRGLSVTGMHAYISELLSWLAGRFRSRAELELEVIALRHQLAVLRRQRPGRRTWLSGFDRLLWVWLYRVWPQVLNAMVLVKPATVVQWHRKGFQLHWRWRSRRLGRPKMNTVIRDLIRRMSLANPLWGAPRIHGELLQLGCAISEPTVSRYLEKLDGRWDEGRAKRWLAFLNNHREVIAAFDFFMVPSFDLSHTLLLLCYRAWSPTYPPLQCNGASHHRVDRAATT